MGLRPRVYRNHNFHSGGPTTRVIVFWIYTRVSLVYGNDHVSFECLCSRFSHLLVERIWQTVERDW